MSGDVRKFYPQILEDRSSAWAYLVMDKELRASVWCFCGARLEIRGDRISSDGMVSNFTHDCKTEPVTLELVDWNPNHIEAGR